MIKQELLKAIINNPEAALKLAKFAGKTGLEETRQFTEDFKAGWAQMSPDERAEAVMWMMPGFSALAPAADYANDRMSGKEALGWSAAGLIPIAGGAARVARNANRVGKAAREAAEIGGAARRAETFGKKASGRTRVYTDDIPDNAPKTPSGNFDDYRGSTFEARADATTNKPRFDDGRGNTGATFVDDGSPPPRPPALPPEPGGATFTLMKGGKPLRKNLPEYGKMEPGGRSPIPGPRDYPKGPGQTGGGPSVPMTPGTPGRDPRMSAMVKPTRPNPSTQPEGWPAIPNTPGPTPGVPMHPGGPLRPGATPPPGRPPIPYTPPTRTTASVTPPPINAPRPAFNPYSGSTFTDEAIEMAEKAAPKWKKRAFKAALAGAGIGLSVHGYKSQVKREMDWAEDRDLPTVTDEELEEMIRKSR